MKKISDNVLYVKNVIFTMTTLLKTKKNEYLEYRTIRMCLNFQARWRIIFLEGELIKFLFFFYLGQKARL